MASLPQHGDPHFQRDGRGLSWRGPALVAGAIALGLVLFALLWWRDRQAGFYKPPVAPEPRAGQVYEALPEPLPANQAANASGMGREDTTTASAPHPPVPRPVAPAPTREAAPPPGSQVATAVPGVDPTPISAPAPRYPPDALRNGESGTVLLHVDVGPDGVPTQVRVARTSHSRSLDRAAGEAVRQWRFRPAQRNGQPVPGSVQVPVAFEPAR